MDAVRKTTRSADCGKATAKGLSLRSASRLSKCSLDLESQAAAQAELDRMQKQHRILENQRKSYYEKSQFVLQKHRKEIEILEKEKKELELNVGFAETEHSRKRSKYMEQMSQLLDRQKVYLQAIDGEKTRCNQLDQQITQVEQQIEEHRREYLAVSQSDDAENFNQKKMDMLENRIGYATVQYNKLLAKNSALREEIDGLLKERERFQALYRCLGKTLRSGKKEMLALIEQAKAAYDQRDEVHSKMQVFRRRDESDQAQYTNDIRNLRRTVEHEEKLQDFLAHKWKDRNEGKEKEATSELTDSVTLSKISEKTLHLFRDVFERLKAQHREEDLERLVDLFVQKEEQNYAFFTYVHDVSQDCERLEKEIEESRRRIEELRVMEKKRNVGYQQKFFDLENSLELATKESNQAEEETKTSSQTIGNLKKSIFRLLELAQVPKEDLQGLLGEDTETLSEEVALHLMSILEKRATDIVLAFGQISQQEQASPQQDEKAAEGWSASGLLSGLPVSGQTPPEESSSTKMSSDRLMNDTGEHVKRRALGK